LKLLTMSTEALSRYKNPDNDPRGDWKSDPATAQAGHATQSQFYTLVAPNGKKHEVQSGRCWVYTEEVMNEAIKDKRIWFGESGNNVPRIKTYLNAKERGLVPETIWFASEVSTNEAAKVELKQIFGGRAAFETPKPWQLIERVLQVASDKDSIILDSFAGSGATAHAVLNLNKEDGGNRKVILIEMEDYAEHVTAERVKRVMQGFAGQPGTGGSFDYLTLGEPVFTDGGELNERAGLPGLRQYIYYAETKQALPPLAEAEADNAAFLALHDDTAYYFHYEPDAVTTLSHDFLATMRTRAGQYIIYADNCLLPAEFLTQHGIIFKKIPRDISRF
jgi:adenine-specific DNA-methyltransferase